MAQEWKVTQAFQGMSKEDSNVPEVVNTKGGAKHKYLVQVENQPVAGWFSVLKNPDHSVKEGDTLYGDITTNQWNKPQFTRADRPQEGGQAPGQAAPAAPQRQTAKGGTMSLSDRERLDYAIVMLEELTGRREGSVGLDDSDQPAQPDTDDDDAPLKPSDLPY